MGKSAPGINSPIKSSAMNTLIASPSALAVVSFSIHLIRTQLPNWHRCWVTYARFPDIHRQSARRLTIIISPISRHLKPEKVPVQKPVKNRREANKWKWCLPMELSNWRLRGCFKEWYNLWCLRHRGRAHDSYYTYASLICQIGTQIQRQQINEICKMENSECMTRARDMNTINKTQLNQRNREMAIKRKKKETKTDFQRAYTS